jgi:hypothetical protein
MAVRMVALAAALAASRSPILSASGISGDIRWVRGTVSASSPASLSVTAGDRCLVLKMNASTEIVGGSGARTAPIAPGTLVQAHFRTEDGKVAVVVIDTAVTASQPSAREGTSVRGEVQRVGSSSVSLRVDRGTRDLVFDDHTTLLDRDGHVRATGAKAIAPLLAAGTDVVVTWVPSRGPDTEGASRSSSRRALEVRTLSRVGRPAT